MNRQHSRTKCSQEIVSLPKVIVLLYQVDQKNSLVQKLVVLAVLVGPQRTIGGPGTELQSGPPASEVSRQLFRSHP